MWWVGAEVRLRAVATGSSVQHVRWVDAGTLGENLLGVLLVSTTATPLGAVHFLGSFVEGLLFHPTLGRFSKRKPRSSSPDQATTTSSMSCPPWRRCLGITAMCWMSVGIALRCSCFPQTLVVVVCRCWCRLVATMTPSDEVEAIV